MEMLLHRANTMSDICYLRILQMVHVQTASLVEDLKAYELPPVSARAPAYDAAELRRSIIGANQVIGGAANMATTGAMLETAMEELFIPYTEGQRYLERESKSIGSLFVGLLTAFTRYHVWLRHLPCC